MNKTSFFARLFWRVLMLSLLGWCAAAGAVVPVGNTYKGSIGGVATLTVSDLSIESLSLVCQALVPGGGAGGITFQAAGAPAYVNNGTTSNSYCGFWQNSQWKSSGYNVQIVKSSGCPANSSALSGGCQCNATFDEIGGQCVSHTNKCTGSEGKAGLLNWTEGYTRTPDEGDRSAVGGVYSPPRSGNVCMGGCTVSLQLAGPGVQPLVSQAPTAQGLYRRSVDYPYQGMGTECTQGTADVGADKSIAPPDCPGTVGEFSGKPACFGTAAKPVTPTPLGQPAGAAIAGNPKAGDKPSTGEGSGTGGAGRTPGTGNGDAQGGPGGAAVGGKGGDGGGTTDGTGKLPASTDGKEQAACGAPGQPECGVKVDEKGTPEGVGTSFDAGKKAIDDSAADTVQKIADARDRNDAPRWSFTFSLPTGCTPFQTAIEGFKFDPCQYQGTIHDLLSMLWAAVTAFTIIGMVGRTIRGT